MTDTSTIVNARATDLGTIRHMLEEQRTRRYDVITSATALKAHDASLRVATGEVHMDENGVTPVHGTYTIGDVFCEGLAARMDLPGAYLKKWRDNRKDIFDATVNGMLLGGARHEGTPYPADNRKHLVRLLRGDEGEPGFARAFLSQKYRFIETLDALLAMLGGATQAGVDVKPTICDLTERKCIVNLEAPGIMAIAPTLLAGYRSQFDGPDAAIRAGDAMRLVNDHTQNGWTIPQALAAAAREGQGYTDEELSQNVVRAGIRFSNSETGHGKRTLAPFIRVKVCRNGLVLDGIADSQVHLGGAQGEGIVGWSQETIEKELALITAQTKDSVQWWLSQEFLNEQVAAIEAMAGVPVRNPEVTVKEIARKVGFTKGQADEVFSMFVQGAQPSAAGVANAVSAYAQTVPAAEDADWMERKALPAMKLAAGVR
jgi:hypothetical protein